MTELSIIERAIKTVQSEHNLLCPIADISRCKMKHGSFVRHLEWYEKAVNASAKKTAEENLITELQSARDFLIASKDEGELAGWIYTIFDIAINFLGGTNDTR